MLVGLRKDLIRLGLEIPIWQRPLALSKCAIKMLLSAMFFSTGLTGYLLRELLRSKGMAIILGYHGVREAPSDLLAGGIAVSNLEGQLRFLARHLRPVPLEAIIAPLARGEEPLGGTFAVTFDDGLVSNVRLAVPLLERLGIPATFFVPSGLMNSDQTLWFEELRLIVRTCPASAILGEAGLWPTLPMTSLKKRYAAFIRMREVLKSHEDRREEILTRLAGDSAPLRDALEEDRVVDADLLRRLIGPNFTVGAHSRNHRILAGLPPAQAEEEIHGSRRDLEALLNRSVVHFAYPNGRFCDFNLSTRDLLVKAGFRCAVTAEPGTVRQNDDRFALRRFMPGDLPVFVESFDLLRAVWNDRNRPGDMTYPLGQRLSHLASPRTEAESRSSQRPLHRLSGLKDCSGARRK